jgi:hypothetical protein
VEQINAQRAAEGRPPFQIKTISQGAATSVWAAFVTSAEEVGGSTPTPLIRITLRACPEISESGRGFG